MIQFRTEIALPEISKKLNYRSLSMMLGSCFAENIGSRLKELCFPIRVNPFGILYNPASIANSINYLLEERQFGEEELFFANNLWNSFSHHSSYSSADKTAMLKHINDENQSASQILRSCSHLFITFGTSWVFANKDDGKIVSNCHKLPAKKFDRFRLSVPQMVEMWKQLINNLFIVNPDIHIVLTVSPIRHLKDGAFENQVSKSGLFLLIAELMDHFGQEKITYFPSYELIMDELRDYRFYAADMTHLSETGIAFIQERFESTFLDQESKKIGALIEKLVRGIQHKPFQPGEKNYRDFIYKLEEEAIRLTSAYPFVNINTIMEVIQAKR